MITTPSSSPTPALYVLAIDREYEALIQRVQTHPHDLDWTDARGLTCLHPLCVAPPWHEPETTTLSYYRQAIHAMVDARPDLVGRASPDTGFTPLHTMMNCGNLDESSAVCRETVLYLIRSFPDAVSMPLQLRGLHGTTPFHFACQNNNAMGVHLDILRAMLETNPALAAMPCQIRSGILQNQQENNDEEGRRVTPLELLWARFVSPIDSLLPCSTLDKMELVLRTAYMYKNKSVVFGEIISPQEDQESGKEEPHSSSNKNNNGNDLLCAVCSVECPIDYFELILGRHSKESLMLPDPYNNNNNTNLPLHSAVCNAAGSDRYSSHVICKLLQTNVQCASVPRPTVGATTTTTTTGGRLPFVSALLEGQLTWYQGGVQELLYAHPIALTMPDMETGLYPFMVSAVHAERSFEHLSTTYELLLASPELVRLGETS